MTSPALRRAHATAIVAVLIAALGALVAERPAPAPRAARTAAIPAAPSPIAAAPMSKAPMVVVDSSGQTVAVSTTAANKRFRDLYPAQSQATTTAGVPASNYWALLIGINDYAGSTRDNIGSYQDARDIRKYLLALGWKSDHIVLLTNRNATASMILQSIRWLASKANSSSVVVFNYAGHEKPVHSSSDGDNESRDIAIWASDNRLILDGTFGKEMNRVRASKMWINLAVCRAGGFRDPGMIKSGRVLTFASKESELAYEDPAVHHTVLGWFEVNEGMMQHLGDANDDGKVTVEEAFRYARPHAVDRSRNRQHPFMIDKLSGSLVLRPPPPPPPPAEEQQPASNNCLLIVCTGAVARRD